MPSPTKKPTAKKPAAKKPAAKKAIAKKPAAKRPAAKKPVAKKAVAKKPSDQKSAAKLPVAKKLAAKRRGSAASGESWDKLPPGESEAAFEKFIAIARAQSGPVEQYRGGALILLGNVRRAVAALRGRDAEIAAHLPQIERAHIWSLPELALAVGFAARAAEIKAPEASGLPALFARIYALRDLLLTNAEGLAKAGLLSAAVVENIRAGSGKQDAAQDCIDLAALYRRQAAALRGKTPVSVAQVREAAELGTQALKLLRPAGSRRAVVAPSSTNRDRDLLYTLLIARYRIARRAGAYLWEEAVDSQVPALLSRQAAPAARKPKAPAGGGGSPETGGGPPTS